MCHLSVKLIVTHQFGKFVQSQHGRHSGIGGKRRITVQHAELRQTPDFLVLHSVLVQHAKNNATRG